MNPISGKKRPNFLVAGVAKSGTTSLFHYLRQHPDIYLPDRKETFFFLAPIYKDLSTQDPHYKRVMQMTVFDSDAYFSVFSNAGGKRAIGEVGTFYAYYHQSAIPLIKAHLGDVKIIMILRNPVERAYSAYNHFKRMNLEPFSFEAALKAETDRKAQNWYTMWYYQDAGYYYEAVKAYQEQFQKVSICLYNDIQKDAARLMNDLFAFLDVDPTFSPDIKTRYLVSGRPRSSFIDYFVNRPHFLKKALKPLTARLFSTDQRFKIASKINRRNLMRPEMKPETHLYLKRRYEADIRKLEKLISRDLSVWLQ